MKPRSDRTLRGSILFRVAIAGGLALVVSADAPARARNANTILHEQIPPDPREDVALSISLDGEIPAAIDTPSGFVPAPDPRKPLDAKPAPYSPGANAPDTMYHPDRDTRKPEELSYDEPFTPSTAPFKRLSAFDQVDASYMLSVRDSREIPFLPKATAPLPAEDLFYADMILDLAPGRHVRIPSVGPGARILRARAGVGTSDVALTFFKDGAENWFVEGQRMTRARLVMEIAIPRASLGGDFGDPTWMELASSAPIVASVPPSVARAAQEVAHRIGVSQNMRPHDVVAKMTAYFRAFQDAADGPPPTRDIYLDLALSQKGVCRHRAFAFLVTALALGLPTRMVINEAHAWVEVHDGRGFRRIDLGGAGRMQRDESSANVPYENPADPFAWPPGASRGEDQAHHSMSQSPPQSKDDPTSPSHNAQTSVDPSLASHSPNGASSSNATSSQSSGKQGTPATPDARSPTDVTLEVLDADAHRGGLFHVRGALTSDGDPCTHTSVSITLTQNGVTVPVGTVATDEHGKYDASITLWFGLAVGEYDVRAITQGSTRCGFGQSK